MKTKKFLIIYGIVIACLVGILFLIPDKFFEKQYNKKHKIDTESQVETVSEKFEFLSIDEQFEHLMNNKYDYEYNLMNIETTYKCTGTKNKDKEDGECTEPSKKSYNQKTFSKVFKNANTKYLTVDNIYKLIKDKEPDIFESGNERILTYSVVSNKEDTDIEILTDTKDIISITIKNRFIVYYLKYSNIEY